MSTDPCWIPDARELAAIEATKAALRAEHEEAMRNRLPRTKKFVIKPTRELSLADVVRFADRVNRRLAHSARAIPLPNVSLQELPPVNALQAAVRGDQSARGGPPAKDKGSPCPECGQPRNPSNNRCYHCRPGGRPKTNGDARPAVKPAIAVATRTRASVTPPLRDREDLGASSARAELATLGRFVDLFESMEPAGARFVLSFLNRHFGEELSP